MSFFHEFGVFCNQKDPGYEHGDEKKPYKQPCVGFHAINRRGILPGGGIDNDLLLLGKDFFALL